MNVSVVDNNFPTFYDGWVRDGETHCIVSWVLSRDSVRGNKPVILLLPFPPILCLFPVIDVSLFVLWTHGSYRVLCLSSCDL